MHCEFMLVLQVDLVGSGVDHIAFRQWFAGLGISDRDGGLEGFF